MTKFTRLVAYGCSYTQGQEIIDEQYVPGAEELKRSQGHDEFFEVLYKKYPEFGLDLRYNDLSKPHAWPRHLADKIGIPWANKALPGTSIYNMIYNLDQDLADENILPTDLVILGITSPSRLIHIDHLGRGQSLNLGRLHSWPNKLKYGYPFFIKMWNDPTTMFQFSMALRTLLHIARTRLKDQLYFAECDPYVMDITKNIEPPLGPLIVKTLRPIYLDFKNSGLMISERNMFMFQPKEYQLAGGHLSEAAHVDWAEHLYKNCQRMGLTS